MLVECGKHVLHNKIEKAIETLDFCMNALPLEKIPYDPYTADIIEAYFAAGAKDKAFAMSGAFCDYYYKRLDYFLKQKSYIVSSAE